MSIIQWGVFLACLTETVYGHGSDHKVLAEPRVELGQILDHANINKQAQFEKLNSGTDTTLMENAIGNENKLMNNNDLNKANKIKKNSNNALNIGNGIDKHDTTSLINNAKVAMINSMTNANIALNSVVDNSPNTMNSVLNTATNTMNSGMNNAQNAMHRRMNAKNIMDSPMNDVKYTAKSGIIDNSLLDNRMNSANQNMNDKNVMNGRMNQANNAMYNRINNAQYAMMNGMNSAHNAMLYNRMNHANYALNMARHNAKAYAITSGMDMANRRLNMGMRRGYGGFGSRFNGYVPSGRGSMMTYGFQNNLMTPAFGLQLTNNNPGSIYNAMLPFLLNENIANQMATLNLASNPALNSAMTLMDDRLGDGMSRALLYGQLMTQGQGSNILSMLAMAGNDVPESVVAQEQNLNAGLSKSGSTETPFQGNNPLLSLITASQAMQ